MIALYIALAGVAFYIVYRLIHYFAPSWGTVATNALALVTMFADYLSALPWGSVVTSQEAALIGFGGAVIGNIAARLNGPKAPVGS